MDYKKAQIMYELIKLGVATKIATGDFKVDDIKDYAEILSHAEFSIEYHKKKEAQQ